MNKQILAIIAVCIICVFEGCKKNPTDIPAVTDNGVLEIKSFVFLPADNEGNLSDTITCVVGDNDTITGYYPLNTDASKLVAKFGLGEQDATVSVSGKEQNNDATPNDFTTPVVYTLSTDSATKSYVVVLKKFTGLPIVYINTDNRAINSKDVGVDGTFSIDPNNVNFTSYSGDASFFIHGNTTATYPKVPYKIKLSSKAALLGMPKSKKWILLANYDDRTLIRNYMAFAISRMFGMRYTPRSQFVELVLNGGYVGNYQLTEQIDIDNNRLDINEMDDDDISGQSLTGGYLIEADNKREDDDHTRFTTTLKNNSFIMHDPDDNIPEQTAYISDYFNNTEDALYGNDFKDAATGYRKYLTPESFIEYFWVNEFTRNNDAGLWSSSYLYKDKNDLLNMGPVWDFDIAFGNTTYNGNQAVQGWWLAQEPWFDRLLQDSSFVDEAITKWNAVKASIDSLPVIVDETAEYLHQSEIENFKKWDILNASFPANVTSETAGSYEGEIAFLKDWISERTEWIDNNLQNLYQEEQ